jgi:hypothetical protein
MDIPEKSGTKKTNIKRNVAASSVIMEIPLNLTLLWII